MAFALVSRIGSPIISTLRGVSVACPFFLPLEKLEDGEWLHAGRLPLGAGWSGGCTAPGHEGEVPSLEQLRNSCNLGYAEGCSKLPQDRKWDAIRFAARTSGPEQNGLGKNIRLTYVGEQAHRPVEHGVLVFDPASEKWMERHPDHRVQKMAECFLETYIEKRKDRESKRSVD